MNLLLDATVRMSAIVLAALGVAAALRHRSAALRHWVLAIGISCGAAVPLLQVALPKWPVGPVFGPTVASTEAPIRAEIVLPERPAAPRETPVRRPATDGSRTPFPWSTVVLGGWLAGAAAGLVMLFAGLWRLSRIACAARPVSAGRLRVILSEIEETVGVRRPVALLQSADPAMLMTWGTVRPTILLPAGAGEWSDERTRVVLRHELAHVARRDWPAQVLAETLSALYWFNPLIRFACRRLRSESERACDDAVLTAGIDAARYAEHLLDLARTATATRVVLAMARSSSLEGRVAAMLNHRINRRPLRDVTRLAIVAAFVALTVPLAVAQGRFSTFSGTVVDQTTRGVPDATLVLTNVSTRAKYEVRSDRSGHFQFTGLAAGDYQLEARQAGFATYASSISVADRDVARTIQLHIGSVHETLNVSRPADTATSPEQRQANVEKSRVRVEEARRRAAETCSGSAAADESGGRILPPLKVTDARPDYPDSLKAAGIGGVVTMDALIGTDGTVRGVTVVSSPNPELDRLAADAVGQWQFTPTYLNCTPIEVPMRVTVNFSPK